MLVEDHELPSVQMNIVIMAGAADDPASKPGLANLTAQMLDEGTGKRDALTVADDLEYLGARFSVNSGMDGTFASLQTLKEHLRPALEIAADVILNPSFPEKEWTRVKATHLTSLLQQKDQPGTVASKVFSRLTFGETHPHGRPTDGTEESVNAITIGDMKEFYSAYYRPNNATMILVGDITIAEAKEVLASSFAKWEVSERKKRTVSAAPAIARTGIYLVDKPEAAQSEVRIGHPGVQRNNPDYFALTVMNTILGGQFSSRINMNLRETKGYTYGARSGFSMWIDGGSFVAAGAVKSAVTDSSVFEFMKELTMIRDAGVTDEELAFAKNSLILREPRNFETPGQVAGQLQTLVLYNLPDDYFATYVQNFEKVTAADVKRVAEKYIQPSAMNIVVVGDVATVKDGLGRLGYGEVRVIGSDGRSVQ
jgi:predicted Zn-dependent peptidase